MQSDYEINIMRQCNEISDSPICINQIRLHSISRLKTLKMRVGWLSAHSIRLPVPVAIIYCNRGGIRRQL
jgi:hypothetical protein